MIGKIKSRERRGNVTTVREFTGGWNVIDNEFNMAPRYSRIMRNVERQPDGTIGPRRGTKLLADIASLNIGSIVNMTYFGTFLIAVTTNGNVVAIDGQGTIFLVWDTARAASLPNSPQAWSPTTFASFAESKGHLTIHNGIDKPLDLDSFLTCQYLVDPATGSNVNTPIGRYAVAAVGARYGHLVIAGDPLNPSTIHISSADTTSVFLNDTAPNDSVDYDLASKVTVGDPTIKGIHFYRDRLLVTFEEVILAVQLGLYASTVHTPEVTDVISGFGCISHRTMFPLNEDVYMVDNIGIPFISRARLSTYLVGDRVDQLIRPEFQADLEALSRGTLEDRVFAVQNYTDSRYMIFIPNNDKLEFTTESRCFVYSADQKGSWAEIRGWNFTCGCHSLQNHVFLAGGTQIYHYAAIHDPFYRDYIGDQEMFTDDTAFTDSTGFTPVTDEDDSGIPITWTWELPWADFNKRMNLKRSTFFAVDAAGSARFTVKMFIDDVYLAPDDFGEVWQDGTLFTDDTGFERMPDPLLAPALMQDFVGGSRGAFGADGFGTLFGGGNRTNTPKLYRWPARFKVAKFRFEGDTIDPLRIAAFTISYTEGSIRR